MSENINEIFDKLKDNSLKNNNSKVFLNKVNSKVVTITSLLSLTVAFSTLCGCTKNIDYSANNNSYTNSEISRDYNYTYSQKIVDDLLYNIIDSVRIKFVVNDVDMNASKTHEINDYKKIIDLSEEDILGFYYLVNYDELETEKIIVVLGYENWNDFLIKNNYIDKDGNPNIAVWINDEYQRIYDDYQETLNIENSKGISK